MAAREGQFPHVLSMLHVKHSTPAPAVLLNVRNIDPYFSCSAIIMFFLFLACMLAASC